jgi:hypothetical protein
MDLRNFQAMDPPMLYSILNMKLRNDYRDLDELAVSMDLERPKLEQYLSASGYCYIEGIAQFRPFQERPE